jgi:hypothetical protein
MTKKKVLEYWMMWVVIEHNQGDVCVGRLIDVSNHDDPILLIDGGDGLEIPLSTVSSIKPAGA